MYVHAQFLWMLAYLTPGHAYLTHLAVGRTLSNANGLRALKIGINMLLHMISILSNDTLKQFANVLPHTYTINIYRIAGYCREDFNLAIGSIRDIKIRDHFIRDIS